MPRRTGLLKTDRDPEAAGGCGPSAGHPLAPLCPRRRTRGPAGISDQEIPRPANRNPDSRSRPNRESGIPCFPITAEPGVGDSLPVSRQNREWGERELGISGSGPDASAAGPVVKYSHSLLSTSLLAGGRGGRRGREALPGWQAS
jgi:hypothetical protein